MLNHQYSRHESGSETNWKRVFLFVLGGLFSGALIFISGFILGTRMEAKKIDRFLKAQESRTKTEEKGLVTKEGPKPRVEDLKGDSSKGISRDNGKQRSENKDLTFYQTLASKRKKDSVGLESSKNSKKKSEAQNQVKGVEEKVRDSSGASVTQGKTYTVQVGAYTTMDIAEKVMDKLKKKGYYAYIATKDIQGEGTLYKVWVGEFKDREKAEEQVKRIKVKEKIQAFVVLK